MIWETLDETERKHVQRQLDYYLGSEPDEQERLVTVVTEIMANDSRYEKSVVQLAMAFWERLTLDREELANPGAGHA